MEQHPAPSSEGPGTPSDVPGDEASRPLGSAVYAGLTRYSTEAILVLDPDGRVVDCSPSVRTVLGLDPDDLVGRRLSTEQVDPEQRAAMSAWGSGIASANGASGTIRLHVTLPNGRHEWVDTRLTNLLDDPLVRGLLVNTRVVTEEQTALDELRGRAERDPLTGLPDRTAIERWLEEAIEEVHVARRAPVAAGSEGGPDVAGADVRGAELPPEPEVVDGDAPTPRRHVLLVDLDGIGLVNDAYGHTVGDDVLRRTADRLAAAVGTRRLGRFGGVEFVVLSEPGDDPAELAAWLGAAVDEPLDGVPAAGWQLRLSAGSCAVADVAGPGELLRRADVALAAADGSRSGHVPYDGALDAEQTRRRLLVQQLRRAVAEEQFEVRFAPIVDLADRRLVACESLVRWRHPWRGMLAPEEFMSVAEEDGLEGDLDLLVAERVVEVASAWRHTGHDLTVGLNVSAQGLAGGFAAHLGRLCEEHGLDPAALTVELLESIRPVPELESYVESLHRLGVRLSIDDFGTGYSSLASIHRLGASTIKVDGGFVDGVETDDGSRAIISAAVSIARTFGMSVVAEWVQRESQRRELAALGVHYGQGALFGDPVTAAEFERHHLGPRA